MGKKLASCNWEVPMSGVIDNIAKLHNHQDDLIVIDDSNEFIVPELSRPWKIVIADDEEEVHAMTRMVLRKFEFEGRKVDLISTYSGPETVEAIRNNPDVAILLLDVVMESENSGLEVVKKIREELKNPFVRIILRTGQPGQAPEEYVIRNYDINDYKSKTELTVQKLYTSIIASLRAYRDMRTIEKNRSGLEKIVNSSRGIFEIQSIYDFGKNVIDQLVGITELGNSNDGYAFVITINAGVMQVVAATQNYNRHVGSDVEHCLQNDVIEHLNKALQLKSSFFNDDIFVGYYRSSGTNRENFIYLKGTQNLTDIEKDLIMIFSSNVSVGFDNIYLNNEIVDTQKEVIFTLGEIVETRSKETANHVRRVAEYSYALLKAAGYPEEEAQIIRLASPMHDIGKVGIPDHILNKPGKLTAEEFEIIKTHTTIGYEVLKLSNRQIMKTAAIIAHEHHERWDGNGYPRGLKGEDIHIFGRMTAITDVYDALGQKRAYKEAWSEEEILDYLKKESGKMFDPNLIALFLDNLNLIQEIKARYPNS